MAIQGYDKTSTYSSIATGNVIEASYFTNEFAELFNSFAKTSSTTSSGHRHDGGDAMGGYLSLLSDSDNDTKISVETISISSGAPSYTDSDTITIVAGSATIATIDSGDINVAANKGITFGDDGEKIEGDGTDLTITGNNINLTATADVNIPSGVGLTFATAEKIESDGTDLSITVGSNGDINIPANIGLTFGDDGEKIEGDGTDLTISGNNINLTAVADVNIPSGVGITFATAEKIESDGTDLTITVGSGGDINIPADIGVTFGNDGEKIEGDGTDLTITGNNINLTATADVVVPANVGITFGTGEKIEGDNTDLTVTSGADINLTATSDVNIPANVGITFGDDGEKIEGDGTDLTVSASADLNLTATTDINIPANVGLTFGDDGEKIEGDGTDLTISGNNINLTATADVNIPSGVGITFATAEKIESDGTDLSITVGSGGDINVPANIGVTFGDDGEKIEGDGTDLTISASADLNLTATTDINIPANVGLTFGDDAEKIEGDGTDLTVSGNNINLTATADVNIPSGVGLTFATAEKIESDGTDLSITVGSGGDINIPANIGVTFGDDGEKIEGDGTDLTISSSAILTIDAGADIVLDAGGANVTFKDDGTAIGDFSNSSSDFVITSSVQDKDIVFKGDDGGSAVTALTLDMSDAGAATFNNAITSGAVITSGAGLVIADAGNIGSASDTDAIAIASNGVVTFSQVPVLPNDTIETADIQDNAVTLAKMAGLARGKLIIGNASGDPTALAAGSANYVLTSDGTDIAWAEASGGGSSDPSSADGDSLGTASAEWSDLYLADGGVIYFGNDQEITLTHAADDGLILKHVGTGDGKEPSLTFQAGDNDIAQDDVLGSIFFQAPDEGAGTDAVLVAAGIEAVSEGDFSSSNNATKLSFKTAASEAAAEKMSLSSAGLLTVTGGITMTGSTPTLTIGDAGAEDTKIVFDGNEKDFYVGLDDSENKLIIGRGSAVGTNNILTIIDDEISIGDGSAVDTKIRWDGNAQDYYIGLDDTDDDFKIGKGATVGTTAAIIINEDGIVTQPLQPAFLASSDAVSNVTGSGSSYYPANFANEIFDNNGDYNTTNFTFTAPVTGRYQANVKMDLGGATSSYTRVQVRFQASNRDIIISDLHAYNVSQTDPAYRIAGSSLIDMDASDTLYIVIYGYGGSDVLDWLANSYFSAYLVA